MKIKIFFWLVSLVLLAASIFIYWRRGQNSDNLVVAPTVLETKVNNQAEVEFEVTPVMVSSQEVSFKVRITSHSVDLDFDLMKAALLKTDKEELRPFFWDGGRGGHHLFGQLKFPGMIGPSQSLNLVIEGASGIEKRVFEWKI